MLIKREKINKLINSILNKKIPYNINKRRSSYHFIIYDEQYWQDENGDCWSGIRDKTFNRDEKDIILKKLQESGYNVKTFHQTDQSSYSISWKIVVNW